MSDHERIDFSALDPSADTARWERMIHSVAVRAAAGVAGRAFERSVLATLAGWARPMFAAAAVLAALAALPILLARGGAAASGTPAGLEEALQLSEPVSQWVVEDRAPTTSDLIAAVEDMP